MEEGIRRNLFSRNDVAEVLQDKITILLNKIMAPGYHSQQITFEEDYLMSLVIPSKYLNNDDLEMAKQCREEGGLILSCQNNS